MSWHCEVGIRKENVNTMNIISVDVETNDKLKKAKLENVFYNIIDGQRVSAFERAAADYRQLGITHALESGRDDLRRRMIAVPTI